MLKPIHEPFSKTLRMQVTSKKESCSLLSPYYMMDSEELF